MQDAKIYADCYPQHPKNTKNTLAGVCLAPRVGFEPTTNSLRVFLTYFRKGRTISSP